MKNLALPALLAAVVLASAPAFAADESGPTVVELFTSQSCYSCPPAEAYLGELVATDGIVALEFHVDYWDDLVYGSAGRWKDAFSSPAFTRRQRDYNSAVRGTSQVYTPQMIIDGRDEAVGSRRHEVEASIRRVRSKAGQRLAVNVSPQGNGGLAVALDGPDADPAGVWLVRYIEARTTEVGAGENKGKTLTNHHVVTSVDRIGAWSGRATTLSVDGLVLAPDEGCAVLVQAEGPGPIVGASPCP